MEEYDVVEPLTGGTFGETCVVRHKRNKSEFVLKKHKLGAFTPEQKTKAFGEVVAMAGLHHEHIVKFISYFWEVELIPFLQGESGILSIIMEYCVGGSLKVTIGAHKKSREHFAEDRIARWFRQTADALDHVHRRKMMHRDLKPDNILLSDKEGTNIKIADFGLSISVDSISAKVKLSGFGGTETHAAPEMFNEEPFSNRCDLWALGVVFYEVINLEMPFKTHDNLKKAIYLPLRTSVDERLRKLVQDLLSVDPQLRPRCDEILKRPVLQEGALSSSRILETATWNIRSEGSDLSKKTVTSSTGTSISDISDSELYSASLAAGALDLAFVIDCTTSMLEYLEEVKKNINYIVDEIHKEGICNVRVALVEYRDHPEVHAEFVTRTHDFTANITDMKAILAKCGVGSGGDIPEAVADALHELVGLTWRDTATKMAALICDAPPHGIGISGDFFPNGSPNGYDPMVLCKILAKKGVCLNVVGCEPHVLPFTECFSALAYQTGGKYLPLGDAKQLRDLIIATALEGFSMHSLLGKVKAIIKQVEEQYSAAGSILATDVLIWHVHDELTKQDTRSQTVFHFDKPLETASTQAKMIANFPNLLQAKATLSHVSSTPAARPASSGAIGGARSQYRAKTTTVTYDQVERLVNMARAERETK